MNVIAWNCRGLGSRLSRLHTIELLKNKDHGALCLLETKPNDDSKILKMAGKWGFESSFRVDTLGFARGLLLIWNKDMLPFTVVHHNSQSIHGVVQVTGCSQVRLSFAYVRPNRHAKDLFWADCKAYSGSFTGPWVVLGDFNDIGSVEEHWGTTEINFANINKFVENFNDSGLFDLHLAGPRFSWSRKVG